MVSFPGRSGQSFVNYSLHVSFCDGRLGKRIAAITGLNTDTLQEDAELLQVNPVVKVSSSAVIQKLTSYNSKNSLKRHLT
jgi:hypothetical protein